MSTFPLALGRPTLADRLIRRSIATDIVLVLAGALFTAALAQVTIPLWPVPVTGQTLAVLLVGSTLGAVRGATSLATYALIGVLGLPVFAPNDDGSHLTGMAALTAPSFGYIIGFILSAALVGWIAERAGDRKILGAVLSFLGGTVATFAIGLPWLAISLGLTFAQTLEFGLYPFIIGGLIKAGIAAIIIPGVWAALTVIPKAWATFSRRKDS